MSFDEELSNSSSTSSDKSEELKMLFGLVPNKRRGVPMSAKTKATLYASSLFQNSPSPDELPPPAF